MPKDAALKGQAGLTGADEKTLTHNRWLMASLAVLTFAVCYLRSFVLPHTPLLLWGDQMGYATKGVRVLEGELPYRDFFEFVTPGTDLVYALLFRFLGVALWVPNLVICILAAMSALWMTWCAHRLIRGWLVVLPAVLLTGFVLSESLDATHHWFSTVALMGAVWVLFDRVSLGRVAAAGAFCGVAASFTQTKGAFAVAALIAWLIWIAVRENDGAGKCWRRCLILCGAALAVFAAINGPFILAAGAGHWFWDVIIFPTRYASTASADNWSGVVPEFVERRGVVKWVCFPFMYLAVPLTYAWFFLRMRRAKSESSEPWNQLVLVAVVGLAMLAAVATAPSIRRVSTVSPPAMLLLTWLLSRSGRARAAAALGVLSAAVAVAQVAAIQFRPEQRIDLPIGRVAIPPTANYGELYRWMAENTSPGQWYFGLPPLTLPLRLRNPTPVETLAPGEFTRPEQVDAVIAGLEKTKPPLMILLANMNDPVAQAHTADHLQPFRDYLSRHYRKTKSFPGGYEAWERTDR